MPYDPVTESEAAKSSGRAGAPEHQPARV